MKFWKFQIFFGDGTIIKFPKLTIKEIDRISALMAGGHHVHKNPKRKPKDEGGFPYCAPPGKG